MTEFEQQVAEALTEIVNQWEYRDGTTERSVRVWRPEELAPRVAAAIAAAGKVAIRSAEDGDRARAAALAALRGEQP